MTVAPDPTRTVVEAKAELEQIVMSGGTCICRCCGRRASRYRRRIHAEMARFLCDLVRLTFTEGSTWHHVDRLLPKNGNYAMLRLWGLAEPSSKRTAGANAHGLWSATTKGILFARGATTVPKYLFIWNGKVVGQSDDYVTIREALGTRFSYSELMGGIAWPTT